MRASLPITFKNQMVTFPKYDTLPVNNEVTYSTMSKEEIDRLYPKTGSEVQKVKLTKEEYLKLKSEGVNNTNIAKRFGISDATLYYYLKKWDLPKEHEIKAEKVREEMKAMEEPKEEPVKEKTSNQICAAVGIGRPFISQIVIDLVTKMVDEQDAKGIEKYGTTIDEAKDYDWKLMALEELVDGMKYLVKENQRLQAKWDKVKTLLSEVSE